jgi:hypothetical protein
MAETLMDLLHESGAHQRIRRWWCCGQYSTLPTLHLETDVSSTDLLI